MILSIYQNIDIFKFYTTDYHSDHTISYLNHLFQNGIINGYVFHYMKMDPNVYYYRLESPAFIEFLNRVILK